MLKSKTIAEAIYKQGQGEKTGNIVESVVVFLTKHKMLSMLPNVLFHLTLIAERDKKKNECHFVLAHTVSKELAHATAKKIIGEHVHADNIFTKEDSELIGGFTLKHNGILYDASLKTKLDLLQEKLMA